MQVPKAEGVYRRTPIIGEQFEERFVIVTDREGAERIRSHFEGQYDEPYYWIREELNKLLDLPAPDMADLVP